MESKSILHNSLHELQSATDRLCEDKVATYGERAEQQKQYRIAHFPQVPCKPFTVEVNNLKEAQMLYNTLADYDMFQLKNNIKPDFASACVIEQWDNEDQEWYSWYDEETDTDNINVYFEEVQQRQKMKKNDVQEGDLIYAKLHNGEEVLSKVSYLMDGGFFVTGRTNLIPYREVQTYKLNQL